MKTSFALYLFFVMISNGIAQYQVVDALDNQKISYVHVKVLNQSKGLITNMNGEFRLDSSFSNFDTLIISCVGYVPHKLAVVDLKVKRIVLLKSSRSLEEYTVASKKKKYKNHKIGVTKNPKTKFFDYSITGNNGDERATLIPNKYSALGSIKSVNIYVTDTGFPDANFRLHIYECTPFANIPGKEITTRNIISKGTAGNEWVNVDLSNENIQLPVNGCYVGIEWFDSPKSEYYNDTLLAKGGSYESGKYQDTVYSIVRKGNGAVLGSINEAYKFSKSKTWERNHLKRSWVNPDDLIDYESRFYIPDTLYKGYVHIPNENNCFKRLPCINLEVLYEQDKLKPDFKKPKARKLNKIDKVKKDLYHYPQSNISELFLSIATAFENDNAIYALKYLCVYKEGELNKILEELYTDNELEEDQRLKTAKRIREMEKELSSSELTQLDAINYELTIGTNVFKLVLIKGNWKINPYTSTKIRMV